MTIIYKPQSIKKRYRKFEKQNSLNIIKCVQLTL